MIETGTVIGGRFVVQSGSGAGTSGEVFKAMDRATGRLVAIKMQPPRTFESTRQFDQGGQGLLIDKERAQQLSGIRGITTVHDDGTHEGRQYLVMDYVPGVELSRLADGIQPAYKEFAASVLAQLCAILEQVHERGLLHRDIKPDNIKVTWDGEIWLLDLGSSTEIEGGPFYPGGTHGYAAPEQYRRRRHTVRTDIYSLGAILFDMCAMHVPYQGHQGPPTEQMPQFPAGVLERMDEGLCALGLRMVAYRPSRRPASVSAVLEELKPMLAGPGDKPHPKAPDPDPAEWYRRGLHVRH